MRTIAKPILTTAAILIAVVIAACLVLNAFLVLPATRERIQREIGTAVGIPVSFGSMIGLPYPLGAVRIGAIKAGIPGGVTSFTVSSIVIHPDLSELLRGKLVAAGIVVKSPVLRLPIEPEDKMTPSGVGGALQSPTFSQTIPSLTQGISQQGGKRLETPPSANTTPNQVTRSITLRNIRISNGDFSYLDGKGRPILTFKGLSLDGSLKKRNGNSCWTGSLQSKSVALGTALIVKNIRASVSAPENLSTLELAPITAFFGGGIISGTATLSSLQRIPGYSLSLHLTDARLGKLLADCLISGSSAEGSVKGDLQLTGIAGKGSTMNGKGSLLCSEVVVEPVAFLKQIGQILNIDELKLLRLAEGRCLFRIDQGRFVADDLLLRSENLTLAANGPLDSTGELNLDSRLLFNEKLTGRLRGLLGNKLTPAPESGYSQITFRVTGPALNPKTDLLERLTGIRMDGDLGGLGGLIQGLFGAPKPKPQQQTPQPSP